MIAVVVLALAFSQAVPSQAFLRRICFRDMDPKHGCFGGRSDSFSNSANVMPQSPTDQNVHFKLFTRFNPTRGQVLEPMDMRTVIGSNFDPRGELAIFIHGFTSSSKSNSVKTLVSKLLQRVANVIAVDYSEGARFPFYFQATANARVVGAHLATMIERLNLYGLPLANVHIIGHSLGAQVAGYAGMKFQNPKIGRITGLDPASLNFEFFDRSHKLDPTDADFVQIIHTDTKPLLMLGLGTAERCGHVDIFPNGGNRMPGCGGKLFCDHKMALKYFTASVVDNEFLAIPCPSVEDYRRGRCTSCRPGGCNSMGYNATRYPQGTFVLETRAEYPY